MFIIQLLAFAVAITIHEAAHAWMSDKLGDPTARIQGRLSLNPLAHIDPIGTVLVPILLVILRSPFVFGWAKPVIFDPYNLKNPRKDAALISLAGPFSNIALAVILSVFLRIASMPFSPISYYFQLITVLIAVNIVLAVFNLIPIHPLDGGKVLVGLLPKKEAYELDVFLNRYGLILLLFLIFPTFGGASLISIFITPLISLILRILIPGSEII